MLIGLLYNGGFAIDPSNNCLDFDFGQVTKKFCSWRCLGTGLESTLLAIVYIQHYAIASCRKK